MSAAVPALEVEGLTRTLGGRDVVSDVTLGLGDGELMTLVGPSGCGKSTLMRLVAGLEPARTGRVLIGGRDMTGVAPEHRQVGFVFQEASLFGHLRVAQNIAFGLRHLPRAARTARVDEMLAVVQMEGMGRRYPHELSGGEQQRVALARALAPAPRLVLLDEPFASLDESLREGLGRQVMSVLRATGTAAVLVTHDRREALALGDRVAVMRDGRIEQCGTPGEVHARPVNRFVASFIDVASFVPAPGGGVLVARPHHLGLVPGGNDRVTAVEFRGSAHRCTVLRADGAEVVVDVPSSPAPQPGDVCTVTVTATDLHCLP